MFSARLVSRFHGCIIWVVNFRVAHVQLYNPEWDYWNYPGPRTAESPQYAEQQQPVQQIRSDYLQQQPYNGASVYSLYGCGHQSAVYSQSTMLHQYRATGISSSMHNHLDTYETSGQ
eukprot:809318-Amphidinium_carterae.1